LKYSNHFLELQVTLPPLLLLQIFSVAVARELVKKVNQILATELQIKSICVATYYLKKTYVDAYL
jgi:hypothetical protein